VRKTHLRLSKKSGEGEVLEARREAKTQHSMGLSRKLPAPRVSAEGYLRGLVVPSASGVIQVLALKKVLKMIFANFTFYTDRYDALVYKSTPVFEAQNPKKGASYL